jgi:putative Holliday junction resolvase
MTTSEYIVALDYGNKRIGVAIAHAVSRLPRPLTTLENNPNILDDIRQLLVREQVGQVVVGLPRGMDGGYTAQTKAAEAFKEQLAAVLDIPVHLTDETLTSVEAEAQLLGTKHTKADVDALAAAYILERFFQEHTEVTRS